MLTDQNKPRRVPAWAAALAAVVCAGILLGAGFLFLARRGLGFSQDAQLVLCRQEDGSLLLSWPEIQQADGYQVRVVSEGETILDKKVHGPGCTLPAATGDSLTVSVRPVEAARKGPARTWTAENLTGTVWPAVTSFEGAVEEKGTGIRFRWTGRDGGVFLLWEMEGDQAWPVARSDQDGCRLPVGEGAGVDLPVYGETLTFAAGCGVEAGDVLLCGPLSRPVELERSDFLSEEIQLRAVDQGDNIYTFTWNEARGDSYLVQYCSEDVPAWTDLCRVEAAEEPSCQLKLASATKEKVRVIGVDQEQQILSQSEELEITTGLSALYATVWPVVDLDIYRDTQRQEVAGTAQAAAAFCVLGETGGLFQVRTPDGYGYIDSNYCMINLPDYMGELCAYDIANSYSSLYTVHGYEIPTVTGTVITGYQGVQTGEGQYLVPLLYPTAKKLASAAQRAREDGYRLKIYDAYRPGEASTEIYQITMDHLYDPIPDATYSGVPAEDLPEGIPLRSELEARQAEASSQAGPEDGSSGENSLPPASAQEEAGADSIPAGSDSAPASSDASADPASPAAGPAEEQPVEEPYLTYSYLMTGGEYHLGSFLAMNGSTHNLGIALDLTLERLDNGEELEMQTAIHDLSHYAVVENNNDNANLLAGYMMEAGFGPLSTEWWHFQDDDTRGTLSLTVYQEKGVTLEGWHQDLTGWYYCRSDGSRIRNRAVELDGETWAFDAGGYARPANE